VIFHDHESTQKAGRSGIIVVSVITIFSTMPGKKGLRACGVWANLGT
jgi:hypothetical protein